ncbi:MAG: transposase, partial [Parcubacteria group bacterium]
RGVDKRDIFKDMKDLDRFIESIQTFNQVDGIGSLELHRKLSRTPKAKMRALDSRGSEPLVAIVAFCLNPNHFHFILKQLIDGGIAKFMQKLLGGYTYYFNERHERSGSLFQGTFKSKLIKSDEYFRKIFAYVNQNHSVHDIPESKSHLIFASDREYERDSFDIVDKTEGQEILRVFGGKNNLKKHCKETIAIIRSERGGKTTLEEPDELPL